MSSDFFFSLRPLDHDPHGRAFKELFSTPKTKTPPTKDRPFVLTFRPGMFPAYTPEDQETLRVAIDKRYRSELSRAAGDDPRAHCTVIETRARESVSTYVRDAWPFVSIVWKEQEPCASCGPAPAPAPEPFPDPAPEYKQSPVLTQEIKADGEHVILFGRVLTLDQATGLRRTFLERYDGAIEAVTRARGARLKKEREALEKRNRIEALERELADLKKEG